MRKIALLRGVTPVGKNKIPQMKYLVEILKAEGFKNVETYIQSGNILLETDLSDTNTALEIHNIIKEKIGADLSVIIKHKEELLKAINENPFDDSYDESRVHLVFTNCEVDIVKTRDLQSAPFGEEVFSVGGECFYMYLPRSAEKKRLNNNYLERKLGIVATTRKLSVIKKLCGMV